MWEYPEIDPVAISLGPLQIHWYGLSYLAGLGLVWWLSLRRARKTDQWTDAQISDLIFFGALGIVLGGRLGYMLFYGWQDLVNDPSTIFRVWQGGMSFHGGMLGVFVALYLFGRRNSRTFFQVSDFVAPFVPLGLGLGRLGNFINAELPGRVTDVPWAVIYPGDTVPRHPSSLYQFALEGPVLFAILYGYSIRTRPRMAVSGLFLAVYGAFRLFSELFREPDAHMQFIAFGWLTMGQALSAPMLVIGMIFVWYAYAASKAK
jgi:phosphatidylglycerol:prolipoprotein diacylglycerol transferase